MQPCVRQNWHRWGCTIWEPSGLCVVHMVLFRLHVVGVIFQLGPWFTCRWEGSMFCCGCSQLQSGSHRNIVLRGPWLQWRSCCSDLWKGGHRLVTWLAVRTYWQRPDVSTDRPRKTSRGHIRCPKPAILEASVSADMMADISGSIDVRRSDGSRTIEKWFVW